MRKAAESHPCVFAGSFVREQVDPRVKARWEHRFGKGTPFGRLRLLWRTEHCQTLNPYDSRWCPYTERDCALAFLVAVDTTIANARTSATAPGYFRAVSKKLAIERADQKPLARERHDAPSPPARPSDPGAPRPDDRSGPDRDPDPAGEPDRPDDPGLRGRLARPDHIGTVLRTIDLGPREGRADDGQARTERR